MFTSGAAEMGYTRTDSPPPHLSASRQTRAGNLEINACFFKTFSTNFCCQGFKHTKNKWIQTVSCLHLLEIPAALREAMTTLNALFALQRQIWHINAEVHINQGRMATVNCSVRGCGDIRRKQPLEKKRKLRNKEFCFQSRPGRSCPLICHPSYQLAYKNLYSV